MRKPISTRLHGVLDILTAGAMLVLPRVLDCKHSTATAMTALGLQKLGYGLMTRHELGLVKLIPMPVHLVLDALGGATLAAVPYLTDEDDEATTMTCMAMGLFDIAAAPMTETRSPYDRQFEYDRGSAPYPVPTEQPYASASA